LDTSPKLILRSFIDGESISKSFDCGEETLNKFIHKEVSIYQKERLGITYLIHLDSELLGFVTISMADVKTEKMEIGGKIKIRLESYPALQIGQLAIDKKFQGQGYGKKIIIWCMSQALEYSREIGCRLLVLNSLPSSVEFYHKCNFKQLKRQENRREKVMYLIIPNELFR
jgi:GNAT superfamily N-acetyltransferase